MERFRRAARRAVSPARSTRCSTALLASYARVGRPRAARRRSRSWTGARCRPGPSSRSCATRSSPPACRRSSAIRAIWCSTAGALTAGGRRIDLVYRRVLINDILSRPDECRALVDAYAARAVCVANTFRCKLAHKKAFFAVLTDRAARRPVLARPSSTAIRAHVPWTRLVADAATEQDGRRAGLLAGRARASASGSCSSRTTSTAAPASCSDGRRPPSAWDDALEAALRDPPGTWVVQERIPVRREIFPQFDADGHGHDAGHAGGHGAVPVSRPDGRIPDAAERDRASPT